MFSYSSQFSKFATSVFSNIVSKATSNSTFYLRSIHRLPALGVIALLAGSQLSFTTLNLLTPFIQQKNAMSSLMKMLQLDKVKAEATGSTAISSSSASSTKSGSSIAVSGSSSRVSSSSISTTGNPIITSTSSSKLSSTSTSSNGNTSISSTNSSSNNSNSSSATSISWSSSSRMITLPTFISANFGVNKSIEATVQCVDSSADGTFSVVIGYKSNIARKEITSSKLSLNRPVIHTHFDRLDKNTLDFNDPNITTKLSGPITYFKGVENSQTSEQKAMIIQGQGTETISWEFIVDGKTYTIYANKDYAVKCQKPTVQTIDGNAAANLIPPVDPKYIVYEYSNIMNFDSTFVMATENEKTEAGTQVRFYLGTKINKNHSTSLWYYDSVTQQIKSKVDGMCLDTTVNFSLQLCNKNSPQQQINLTNVLTNLNFSYIKNGTATNNCFGWYNHNDGWSSSLQNNQVCADIPLNRFVIQKVEASSSSGLIDQSITKEATKFKLTRIDCQENANTIFGATNVVVESRNSANEIVSVKVKFNGNDRVLSCDQVSSMQTLDLSSTPQNLNKSVYGFIMIKSDLFGHSGFNFDTLGSSGIENTPIVAGAGSNVTKKSQNWFYDKESQQIKSAFEGMCVGFITNSTNLVVKNCDRTGNDQTQKFNIIQFNGLNKVQNLSSQNCIDGEVAYKTVNGTQTIDYTWYVGRKLSTSDCGFFQSDYTIDIKSQIDPRDSDFLALENDRLQKLYNGSVPAKDVADFGYIEDNLGNVLTVDSGAYFGWVHNDVSVTIRAKDTTGTYSQKQKWKYNSTTKQIYNEFSEICLATGLDIGSFKNITRGIKCSTLDNTQKFNVMKMTDDNYMIQNLVTKNCLDQNYVIAGAVATGITNPTSCGKGLWKGSALSAASTTFPVLKVSIPLINILSNTNTNGKRWTLDVKAGTVGTNSELFIWEGVQGNTNQMFAYNPDTSEIYYNPSRQTEPTGQKVIITDPADSTKKIEVPVFVKNFSEAMTCLDAEGSLRGTRIKIKPCNGKVTQKWSFTNLNGDITKPVIRNIAENYCIDAEGSWKNPTNQMYNGRNAVVWDCHGQANQQFVKYEKGELLAKNDIKFKNSIMLSAATNPIDFGNQFQSIAKYLNSVTTLALESATAPILDLIINGNSTVNTTNSPCYTDFVKDELVCNLAKSPDPILDPLEQLMDSIYTKNTKEPTTQEQELANKAKAISETINNQLEQINNPSESVIDLNKVKSILDIVESEAAKIEIKNTQGSTLYTESESNSLESKPTNPTISSISELDKALEVIKKQNSNQSENLSNDTKQSKSMFDTLTQTLANLNPFNNILATAQSQPWTDGIYYISLFQNTNFAMDIRGANTSDQTPVQLYQKNGTNAQKWILNGNELKGLNGKCLDSGEGRGNSTLRLHTCHGGWNQKWTFYNNYTIQQYSQSEGRQLCVSVQDGNISNSSVLRLTRCDRPEWCDIYWDYEGASGYDRNKIPVSCGGTTPPPPAPPATGNYKILNLFNKGLAMDVNGANTTNQTKVQYWSDNNGIAQKWTWYNTGEIRGLANKCLDSGSANNGDWLRINDCNGGKQQRWSINRDYGITQNNLCIGSDGLYSGSILKLKSCTLNDCSSYLEYAGVNDYTPNTVRAQGCGSFTSSNGTSYTPVVNTPPYVPPTPNSTPTPTPNPSPTPTPTPNPGTGTNTPTFVPLAEELEPYNDTSYQQFLNSEVEVSATATDANVSGKLYNSVVGFGMQQWKLTSALYNQCQLLDGKCNSEWGLAFVNSVLLLANFLIGLVGGALLFIGDSIEGIVGFIESLPNIKDNIGGILQNIGQLNNVDTLSTIFIKYGAAKSQSVYDVVDEFNNADIYTKWQIIGIKTAFVLLTAVAIYKTIAALFNGVSTIVSKAKGLSVGSAVNIATSLLNNSGVLRIGSVIINGARVVDKSVRARVAELFRNADLGKAVELKKYITPDAQKWINLYSKAKQSPNFEVINNIAKHSYYKHVTYKREFPSVSNPYEFMDIADEVLKTADIVKVGLRGRTGYYRNIDNVFIVKNTNMPSQSSMFKPDKGARYIIEDFN